MVGEVDVEDDDLGRPFWESEEAEVGVANEDGGVDIERFYEEEDERRTTSKQVAAGVDPQNIPWDRLQVSRERYRHTRLQEYHNYVNRQDVMYQSASWLRDQSVAVCMEDTYYDFHQNEQRVRSDIAHFQLRHLLWTSSKHDVYTTVEHCINHWNSLTGKVTTVLDLSGPGLHSRGTGFGQVQVSTFCVEQGLLAVGGFVGELILADARTGALLHRCDGLHFLSKRVTTSDMGITNGIDIFAGASGATAIMTANNDNFVRVFDAEVSRCLSKFDFEWPVNLAVAGPCGGAGGTGGGSLVAMVGDYPESCVVDLRSNARVATLAGHLDFTFAAAWHPDQPHTLATGNQDTSTRVWDLRKPSESVAVLCGNMGAVRSLRFSPDGRVLAAAEPADFVRLYDVAAGYSRCQEIDLFGEIGGIAFTPDCSSFFLCVADIVYSSLMEFTMSPTWREQPLRKALCP